MKPIRYTSQKKYRLDESIALGTNIIPARPVDNGVISLDTAGILTIRTGFEWDGPSGPAIDTGDFMRASCVHDALYQLMWDGLIEERHRKGADLLLRRIAREDGMGPIRAWYVYRAVRWFGGGYATPLEASP